MPKDSLKICCFPSNLLGKKAIISEDMATLTSNTSEAFLQNLAHLRMQRDNTPTNVGSSGKSEEIVLLEKQGRCSQKLRSNLAQVSSTIGHNMTDISNICQSPGTSKLPKIVLPPRKDRQSSAPPSALPRPPRTLKPPRKIEYGRLSESGSSKSNSKSEYEMKTSSLKRQSPTASGSKNYVDIKSELQMALNPTKNNAKTYGTIKTDTANNITKIYYSNKPDFISNASYQRLPESPTSSDSVKKFSGGSSGKKIMFMRSSPSAQHQSREGSISSGSNSRSSPKLQEMQYQQLSRSRTRTPPKYLHLNPMGGVKFGNLGGSNNSSPTKPTLPSSSVLYHQAQAQSMDWKQPPIQHQRGNSGRSNSGSGGENKYRIQF